MQVVEGMIWSISRGPVRLKEAPHADNEGVDGSAEGGLMLFSVWSDSLPRWHPVLASGASCLVVGLVPAMWRIVDMTVWYGCVDIFHFPPDTKSPAQRPDWEGRRRLTPGPRCRGVLAIYTAPTPVA